MPPVYLSVVMGWPYLFHPIHSISGSQLSLAPSSVIHMGVIITALFGYKLFLSETGYPGSLSRLWSFLFSSLPERRLPLYC